jgi:AmmeMemoRadiSam system protein A
MYQPKTIYAKIALKSILNFLQGISRDFEQDEVPESLLQEQRGCFVSLHKNDGALRGCIGTIEPIEGNLYKEIQRNAVSAAFRDNRFSPITWEELEDIEISVDVLTVPEEVFDLEDLDPQIYGVIVTDGSSKRAVLLPSIPSIDTLEKQIKIVKRKAGLEEVGNEYLKFYRFTSNRYH